MNFTVDQFGILSTLIISVIAIIISALAFFRGRNIDLQNQLYLKKLEAYEAIFEEFIKLISLLRKNFEKLHHMDIENLSESQKDEINDLSYQVDLEIDQIQQAVLVKSVYFSNSLVEKFVAYLNSLYGDVDRNGNYSNEEMAKLINSYTETQTEELESLINEMRNELGLDDLNQKLFKRIQKGNFRFDV
jgi:hypothetical protein